MDSNCLAVTTYPNASAPFTLRASAVHGPSPSGEASSFITNIWDCRPPAPPSNAAVLDPLSFSIAFHGFQNDVTAALQKRYRGIFFAYGVEGVTVPPGSPHVLPSVSVTVTTSDDRLRFGINESYSLSVSPAGATITAPTVFGALWGLETLSNLITRAWSTTQAGAPAASWYQVPFVEVVDAPRFPYRGIMVDSARHYLSPGVLRQTIDLMSYMKLNALHLHLTDDDCWPLLIPAFPNISNLSAYSSQHVFTTDALGALVQYGRERGVIVFPEVDTPAHASPLRAAFPDLGCFVPGGGGAGSRVLIDPAYPALWDVLGAIWGTLAAVFPPSYPFHIGADEVARGDWGSCPSALAWASAHNITWDGGTCVCSWYERSLYEMLLAPPYNRTLIMAWEDACWDESWGGVGDHLVLQQWNQGAWRSDTCTVLATNASVVVSGPFSVGETTTLNHLDLANLTCGGALTPRQQAQLVGPEFLIWGDAADTSSSSLCVLFCSAVVFAALFVGARTLSLPLPPFPHLSFTPPPPFFNPPPPPPCLARPAPCTPPLLLCRINDLMLSVLGLSETGWSSQEVVAAPVDSARYTDARCRFAARGITSTAEPFSGPGTVCTPEYAPILPSWDD